MCLISHHHVSTSVSEYSLQNWMHTLNSVFSQIMCVWFSTGQSQQKPLPCIFNSQICAMQRMLTHSHDFEETDAAAHNSASSPHQTLNKTVTLLGNYRT